MDGAGKPVCLGGGESVTAGRVFLSAHGGKAFFAAGGCSFRQDCGDAVCAHTAAGANCSEGAYPLRRGREKQRRHLRRTAKRNRNVAGKAQRRGRVLLSAHGGKAFFAAGGCSFRQDCGDAVCAHTAAGRGIGTASSTVRLPQQRAARRGGCLCTQTAEKTAGKQKSPITGDCCSELKIPRKSGDLCYLLKTTLKKS